jgi:hypothetical protein
MAGRDVMTQTAEPTTDCTAQILVKAAAAADYATLTDPDPMAAWSRWSLPGAGCVRQAGGPSHHLG